MIFAAVICIAVVLTVILSSAYRAYRAPTSTAGPSEADRPALKKLGGFSSGEIEWEQRFNPPLSRAVEYADRHGEYSERLVSVVSRGTGPNGRPYLGITESGKFKTLREDRVLKLSEPLPLSRNGRLRAVLHEQLPPWHTTPAVFKVPSVSGNRRWTVDLASYTCTCPERRIRSGQYAPKTMGMVCPHMARAIQENHPNRAAWPKDLVDYIWSSQAGSQQYLL